MKTRHYMFDFDGTLVDSMPYWAGAMIHVLDKSDAKYPPDIIRTLTPMGVFNTCRYMHEQYGVGKDTEDVMNIAAAELTPLYYKVIPLKKGVREKLTEFKEKGIGISVLTASPHLWVDACLKNNGVFDLFDNVWTCEDFKTPKTNPETYKEAAERVNLKIEECAFLDDNINACKAAAKSGIVTIGVFDETSKDDKDEFIKSCDRYIISFDEL